jgi:polysaccharide biosynthesis transport protein
VSNEIARIDRRLHSELAPRYPVLPTGDMSPQGIPHFNIRDLWFILRKRKWVLFTTMLVVLTISIIQTARTTPLYDASARLAFYREDGDMLGMKDASNSGSTEDFDYTVSLDTQARVIQSDVVALQVIRGMHLDTNRTFAKKIADRKDKTQLTPDNEADLLENFRGSLRVVPIRNTRILELHFSSPDPKLAADIVNTLMRTYVEHNFKTKLDATLQATDWMASQIADLQLKVEASQQALVKYQRENQILGTDEKQNITTSKLDQLNHELTQAQADRIQKEAKYQNTLSGNLAAIPELSQNTLIASLQEQAAIAEREYAEANVRFGPNYPKVVELQQKMEQARASVKQAIDTVSLRIKADYQTALERERLLSRAFDSQKTEANNLNEKSIQYELLKRDAELNRKLYESLLEKSKEANVSAGLKSNNVRPVDTARTPRFPSSPNIPRNMILALLLGTSTGVALAFVLEGLDNRVRTPDHIEATIGMPALATIPLQHEPKGLRKATALAAKNDGGSSGLIVSTRPRSHVAEAYRALRTSILLALSDQPPKSIVVTSGLPREGKTTTSLNLAAVLAQKGARVLLVDADLRRPSVHTVLRIRGTSGLSTLLTGGAVFEDVVQPAPGVSNLWVVPAGAPPSQPSELLSSAKMRELITRWEGEYDHVIIDTPPVLSVTDAVSLSSDVDGVLMVVRAGNTRRDALRRMQELLAQVNARQLGVVLNAIDLTASDTAYYYYYGGAQAGYYDNSH